MTEVAMKKNFDKGHITFILDGKKLKGEFALIRLKKDPSGKSWLMVKKRDEFSTYKRTEVPDDLSVKSGRTIDEITAQSEEKGDIWISNKKKSLVKPKVEAVKKIVPSSKAKKALSDPMPRKIKPMIPTIAREEGTQKNWLRECHEGLRAIAEVEGRRIHLYSKSGLPFNSKFPEIVKELSELSLEAVLDGEIVGKGRKSIYRVFDILYKDGRDLRSQILTERKKILSQAFKDKKHVLHGKSADHKSTFVGLSVLKNPDSTYQSGTTSDWLIEREAKPARKAPILTGAQLTHADKLYFPDDGITKGEVFEYYRSISKYILPHLKDRPESLNRHPNGIKDQGFYQKDVTGYYPKWFKTQRIYSESSDKSINYALIQDEQGLLYVANLGCIELNPWFSRIQNLDKPDFLVIDIDPDENDFDDVMEVSLAVHQLLDEIGAPNFVKTSGATGMHIGVPMAARYSYDDGKDFAFDVVKIIQKKFPTLTSLERSPSRRRNKIYLDFLQNRRGQTLAAAFCLRPRPGAPVSMPLKWNELRPGLVPSDFNIHNALQRIKKTKDPWKGVLGPGLDLKKCRQILQRKLNKK